MKLRELLSKATPGRWNVMPCSNGGKLLIRGDPNQYRPPAPSTQMIPSEDAELIAHLRNHAEAYVKLEEAAQPFTNYINKTTERIPTESDWLAFEKAIKELEKP